METECTLIALALPPKIHKNWFQIKRVTFKKKKKKKTYLSINTVFKYYFETIVIH